MFKIFKYMFLINLYKKTKNSVVVVGIAVLFLFFTAFISNDLMEIIPYREKYIFILLKWLVISFLLWIIVRNVNQVWKVANVSIQVSKSTSLEDKKSGNK